MGVLEDAMRLLSIPLIALIACSGEPATEEASTTDDTLDIPDVPAENPYGSAKNCPVFETGTVEARAGGVDRVLEIELPKNPRGAPVVFAWHWLGGDATETLDWMGVRELADAGYIVVAPESSGLPFEWDTLDRSDDNVDLALVDSLLPCLFDAFAIDSDAVFATGHSAGGLFTTFLTMHRAEVFAATAPFSGGASSWDYETPARPIPSLVTWGGVNDTYGGFSFHTASLDFVSMLLEDGSFPIACEHDLGHLPPNETVEMLEIFFGDHRLDTPEAWKDSIPSGMPDYCSH